MTWGIFLFPDILGTTAFTKVPALLRSTSLFLAPAELEMETAPFMMVIKGEIVRPRNGVATSFRMNLY